MSSTLRWSSVSRGPWLRWSHGTPPSRSASTTSSSSERHHRSRLTSGADGSSSLSASWRRASMSSGLPPSMPWWFQTTGEGYSNNLPTPWRSVTSSPMMASPSSCPPARFASTAASPPPTPSCPPAPHARHSSPPLQLFPTRSRSPWRLS